jgi:hypothetical protein
MSASKMKLLTSLLACLVVGLASAPTCIAADNGRGPASIDELRVQRKQAANRTRRVIFNNDGNEPVYLCKDTTPEELLSHRTTPLIGSHVDSIFYCTWSSGFGLFTHGTKVGAVFATREKLFAKNLAPELIAAGTDPLRVMTDFGRKNGIEIFWSFRVNDTHDGSTAEYGPIMFAANQLKRDHPDWLIGSPAQKPKFGAWSAVDFARTEVRDLAFKYVEEVCQKYPVDGVELDFFRHPVLFKRPAQSGTACNDAERGLLSELLLRIRHMSEQEGLRRGRPILIAVRVPDSVEYCRAIGIDLEKWLGDGLVDLLVTGGYFQLNEWTHSVALGKKYGVKVYPSLDESRVRDPGAKQLRSSVESYRGRAAAARRAGVDGLYLFNSFNPRDQIWRELGSDAALAKLDKDYFASVLGRGAAAGGALPHADYIRVSQLNPAQPITLSSGGTATTKFFVGDDFRGRRTSNPVTLTLRVQFNRVVADREVVAKLNGVSLERGAANGNWLEFAVSPDRVEAGENVASVALGAGSAAAAWTDLHFTVRFGPK